MSKITNELNAKYPPRNFKPDEIIAAHEKWNKGEGYGKLFEIALEYARLNTGEVKTLYIPLLCRHTDGKLYQFNYQFSNQLLGGHAKVRRSLNADKKPKHVDILFRPITLEDLAKSDYEDKRGAHKLLIDMNSKHLLVNNIITEEYKIIANSILDQKTNKDKSEGTHEAHEEKLSLGDQISAYGVSISIPEINHFKQDTIALEPDAFAKLKPAEKALTIKRRGKRYMPIKDPLYRYKIGIINTEPYYLQGVSKSEKYKDKKWPLIFDGTKKTANGEYQEAKINGNPLNVDTVEKFLRYLSSVNGTVDMSRIIVSGQGVSIQHDIRKLIAITHYAPSVSKVSKEESDDIDFICGLRNTKSEQSQTNAEVPADDSAEDNTTKLIKKEIDDLGDAENAENTEDLADNDADDDDANSEDPNTIKKTQEKPGKATTSQNLTPISKIADDDEDAVENKKPKVGTKPSLPAPKTDQKVNSKKPPAKKSTNEKPANEKQ